MPKTLISEKSKKSSVFRTNTCFFLKSLVSKVDMLPVGCNFQEYILKVEIHSQGRSLDLIKAGLRKVLFWCLALIFQTKDEIKALVDEIKKSLV